jgi:hypothetical protein
MLNLLGELRLIYYSDASASAVKEGGLLAATYKLRTDLEKRWGFDTNAARYVASKALGEENFSAITLYDILSQEMWWSYRLEHPLVKRKSTETEEVTMKMAESRLIRAKRNAASLKRKLAGIEAKQYLYPAFAVYELNERLREAENMVSELNTVVPKWY